MKASILSLAIMILPLAASAAEFEAGFCAWEHTPTFRSTAYVKLFSKPDVNTATIGAVAKGEAFTAIGIRCKTTSAGRYRFTAPLSVRGHNFGRVSFIENDNAGSTVQEFRFKPGDTIDYLMYRGEGFIIARFGKDVIEINEPTKAEAIQDSAPVVERWVKVKGMSKRISGWLLVDGRMLQVPSAINRE